MIRFAGGDSNIYGYVFSDPINFIDPNGEIPLALVINGAMCLANAYSGYKATEIISEIPGAYNELQDTRKEQKNNRECEFEYSKKLTEGAGKVEDGLVAGSDVASKLIKGLGFMGASGVLSKLNPWSTKCALVGGIIAGLGIL